MVGEIIPESRATSLGIRTISGYDVKIALPTAGYALFQPANRPTTRRSWLVPAG